MEHTDVEELKGLNLLGVQFALCECSKWLFYLRYDSGSIYRPSSRDFELALQEVKEVEAARLQAIWMHSGREFWVSGFLFFPVAGAIWYLKPNLSARYWEEDDAAEAEEAMEDELHPDHRVTSGAHRV